MFDTLSTAHLQSLLDLFSIPMFALDRMSANDPFRIVCMNKALEHLSQHSREEMIGRSVYDLLPKDQAEEASQNYIKCANTSSDVRFSEVFTENGNQHQWDTTLQCVQTNEGHDRIVGTTQRMAYHLPRLSDQFALEEVQYYSTIADLHLQNMATLCDLIAEGTTVDCNTASELQSTQLMAVCRSVQRAVSDVKHTVRQAQARHTPQLLVASDQPVAQNNDPFSNVTCGTVSAMVALASSGPQRLN